MDTRPIGVFDSGSGGLSVVDAIGALTPKESIVYIGDHAHAPYGNKTTEYIRERAVKLISFLTRKNCKLVVVACNTATIAGIEYFRSQFPKTPIIGVVPVIKTAAAISKTKRFIVLSTHFTAKSHYQRELIREFAKGCDVVSVGSERLVPLIEKGQCDGESVNRELNHIFERVKHTPYDVIALGCTHYPFIRKAIRAIVGDGVEIIDSGGAVARQVHRILEARNEQSEGIAHITYLTTGKAETVSRLFGSLLGKAINVSHVTV